jgi:hypothetical protein
LSVKVASDEYKALKKEVSRMASMANKRLKRLEKNELTHLPSYKSWEEHGSIKFSVKGKTHQQLQSEYWRLKNFLDAKTSTVRGANAFLKEMAQNTGIKYNGLADLKTKSQKFFELANKIKQYYKNAEQSALALDYQKIWQQINEQIKQGVITIDNEESTESVLNKYLNAMDKVQPVETNSEGYKNGGTEWDFIKL